MRCRVSSTTTPRDFDMPCPQYLSTQTRSQVFDATETAGVISVTQHHQISGVGARRSKCRKNELCSFPNGRRLFRAFFMGVVEDDNDNQ